LGGVPGFRDLLPEEAEIVREAQESLLAEMRRWGYRHVITPMVETTAVLELGLGAEQRRRLFKFTDVGGEVVALVGERTVPVARLVAGQLRSTPLPVRLCYAGPVMASDAGRFSQRRERYQVGAELVGARGTYADAEVIALAARCLEAAGLRRYQVDVGHAEFFQGIMDAVKLPDAVKAGVTSCEGNTVKLIVRETYQDPRFAGKPSFPMRRKREVEFRPYTKESLLARQVEVFAEDEEEASGVEGTPATDDVEEGMHEVEDDAETVDFSEDADGDGNDDEDEDE